MFDHGADATALDCGYRVRVPAPGARCRWQTATRVRACGTAAGVFMAAGPMPVMFQHAVRGHGAKPTAITKRHRLRPSECLM